MPKEEQDKPFNPSEVMDYFFENGQKGNNDDHGYLDRFIRKIETRINSDRARVEKDKDYYFTIVKSFLQDEIVKEIDRDKASAKVSAIKDNQGRIIGCEIQCMAFKNIPGKEDTPEEHIRVLIAHELAHVMLNHISSKPINAKDEECNAVLLTRWLLHYRAKQYRPKRNRFDELYAQSDKLIDGHIKEIL